MMTLTTLRGVESCTQYLLIFRLGIFIKWTIANRGRMRENDLRFILYPRVIRFDHDFNSVVPNRRGVFVRRLYSLSLWSLVYLFLSFLFIYLRDGHPGIACGQYTGVFVFRWYVTLCVGISAEQLLGYRATKKRRFFFYFWFVLAGIDVVRSVIVCICIASKLCYSRSL